MPVGAHGGDGRGRRVIQVDENVAGVLVVGVGLHIDVAALAVAHAQKADRGRMANCASSRGVSPGNACRVQVVNQADQVEIVGHGGQLSANGLQGEKETAVFHDRNFAVGTNRRTMNFERTAELCLNCLSQPRGQVQVKHSLKPAVFRPNRNAARRVLVPHAESIAGVIHIPAAEVLGFAKQAILGLMAVQFQFVVEHVPPQIERLSKVVVSRQALVWISPLVEVSPPEVQFFIRHDVVEVLRFQKPPDFGVIGRYQSSGRVVL